MDDVYLNPLLGQPSGQPEAVTAGLEGNCDARDGATFADCLKRPSRERESLTGEREVTKNWDAYCEAVSDNFRIINPTDFRILA
jgi:hypothetical protein